MNKSLGQILKRERANAHRTVKEVSDILIAKGFKAGINTVYSWENDNSQPTPDILLTLCELYGIADVLGAFGYEATTPRTLTPAAQRIGRLYDKADDRAREIVDFTLKPFDTGDDAPPRSDTEFAAELAPVIEFESVITDVPLYTQSVAAGLGNYLDSDDYEMVGFANVPRRANIAVRITGDSMESLYHDGDIVFVETDSVLSEGEIGIFNYESSGYIKKLMFNPPRLVSLNKRYPDIYITEDSQCYTIGRVVGKASK